MSDDLKNKLDAGGQHLDTGDTLDAKEYRRHRANRGKLDPYFPEGTVHEDVFTVLGDRLFVWDKPKNESNKFIHGIDFYTAVYVFNDEYRLEDDNEIVDGELREQIIGEPEGPIIDGHPINTLQTKGDYRRSGRRALCCIYRG